MTFIILIREHTKKNAVNMDFVQNRSDPPSPPDCWIFWDTFPKVKTFGTCGTLLGILIHPILWQKSVPKLLDLVKLPPFYQKLQKCWFSKSVPKLLVCFATPPPLWTKSKLKLHIFWGSVPNP